MSTSERFVCRQPRSNGLSLMHWFHMIGQLQIVEKQIDNGVINLHQPKIDQWTIVYKYNPISHFDFFFIDAVLGLKLKDSIIDSCLIGRSLRLRHDKQAVNDYQGSKLLIGIGDSEDRVAKSLNYLCKRQGLTLPIPIGCYRDVQDIWCFVAEDLRHNLGQQPRRQLRLLYSSADPMLDSYVITVKFLYDSDQAVFIDCRKWNANPNIGNNVRILA